MGSKKIMPHAAKLDANIIHRSPRASELPIQTRVQQRVVKDRLVGGHLVTHFGRFLPSLAYLVLEILDNLLNINVSVGSSADSEALSGLGHLQCSSTQN